jgi:acyl-coenzyme A synthetase/AMP-(fatty) acid ligase
VSGATVTEDALLVHCRERLAAYQVPARIAIVLELPRNAVGKLVRQDLARLAATAEQSGLPSADDDVRS